MTRKNKTKKKMMIRKKINKKGLRTCVGCRNLVNRQDVITLKNNNGVLLFDKKGNVSGRGIHLCKKVECYDSALKKGIFQKVYHSSITIYRSFAGKKTRRTWNWPTFDLCTHHLYDTKERIRREERPCRTRKNRPHPYFEKRKNKRRIENREMGVRKRKTHSD